MAPMGPMGAIGPTGSMGPMGPMGPHGTREVLCFGILFLFRFTNFCEVEYGGGPPSRLAAKANYAITGNTRSTQLHWHEQDTTTAAHKMGKQGTSKLIIYKVPRTVAVLCAIKSHGSQ